MESIARDLIQFMWLNFHQLEPKRLKERENLGCNSLHSPFVFGPIDFDWKQEMERLKKQMDPRSG